MQTYNDGVVKLYCVKNIAEAGNRPKEALHLKRVLRYAERTVGLGRFWTAKQAQVEIDLLLRVQKLRDVSTQDIAIPNDGQQYKIVQIQYPEGKDYMDLSLERLVSVYDVARV